MARNFASRLLRFATNTDTHGVKFIVTSEATLKRRVFWSLALLGSFTFLAVFFSVRFINFFKYETTTKTEYTTNRKDMKLPTIAVCAAHHYGKLVASRLTASDIINGRSPVEGGLMLAPEKIMDVVDGKRFLKQEVQEIFGEILRNKSVLADQKVKQLWRDDDAYSEVSPLFNSTYSYNNFYRLLETLARHNLSEPIQSLQAYSVLETFQRAGYRSKELISAITCRNDSGVGMFLHKCHSPWRRQPGRPHCFINDLNFGYPVEEVQVHPNKTFVERHSLGKTFKAMVKVNPREESVEQRLLRVGHKVTFEVSEVTRVHRLGPPYEKCGDSSYLFLPVEKRYSRTECLDHCRISCMDDFIDKNFGCREHGKLGKFWAEILRSHLRVCNNSQEIAASLGDTISLDSGCRRACQSGSYTDRKGCPGFSCHEQQYDVSVQDKDLGFSFWEYMSVVVKFGPQVKMTTYHSVPLQTVESLLAELGGTMGLFVGISLLSVLHVLEFIFMEICGIVCKKKGRAEVEPEAVEVKSAASEGNDCSDDPTDDLIEKLLPRIVRRLEKEGCWQKKCDPDKGSDNSGHVKSV